MSQMHRDVDLSSYAPNHKYVYMALVPDREIPLFRLFPVIQCVIVIG